MIKFFYFLSLVSISFISNAQTLSFSKKTATVYLDKTNTATLQHYISDTIKVTTTAQNDTIMFYSKGYYMVNGILSYMTSNYNTYDEVRHMADKSLGYNALWAKFFFSTLQNIPTRGFYEIRCLVYLKHDTTVNDTLHFYLQFAPTGINSNIIEAKNPIHPNPALNEIILDKEVTQVRIIDNVGKEVIVKEISTSNKLDISFLTPGVYYVESFTKEGIIREKLIKN